MAALGLLLVTAAATRGAFAFHYEPSLTPQALEWYSRFAVVVTHDPLPRAQVARLHEAGTKVLLYEWSVAFYESRATRWQRSLIKTHALLNRTPLTGGAGSPTAAAWYFDPASHRFASARAADLARRVRDHDYDGVFLDTTTVESVHPDARAEYERRHPDTPYDVAFAHFLVQLRSKLGTGGVIFTNQGYRKPEFYLPYVDADLSESLITRPVGGVYKVRPWNDPADPWNSIHFLMQTVIAPLVAQYPHVHFSHLNYADGADPDVIRLVVAVAKMFGGDGYVAAPVPADEADPIYFREFGKPLSPVIDVNPQVSYRIFEHATIAISAAREPVAIDGTEIRLPATDGTPHAFFFDR